MDDLARRTKLIAIDGRCLRERGLLPGRVAPERILAALVPTLPPDVVCLRDRWEYETGDYQAGIAHPTFPVVPSGMWMESLPRVEHREADTPAVIETPLNHRPENRL